MHLQPMLPLSQIEGCAMCTMQMVHARAAARPEERAPAQPAGGRLALHAPPSGRVLPLRARTLRLEPLPLHPRLAAPALRRRSTASARAR